jgi:glycosyltransferase involved in cell wall biosynthesis
MKQRIKKKAEKKKIGVRKRKEKKSILVVTDTFFPKKDGITTFLRYVIPLLCKHYKITILAPSYTSRYGEGSLGNARVVKFPVSKINIEGYPLVKASKRKMARFVKEADIIWTHSAAHFSSTAMKLGKKMGKPVVDYVHSIEWELLSHILFKSKRIKNILIPLVRKLGVKIYNRCDLLQVSSPGIARSLKEYGILTKSKVVRLGVDTDEFVPPKSKALAKKKIGMNPKSIIIGYCGRITKEKNLQIVYKACNELAHFYPLTLLLVGDGNKEAVQFSMKGKYKITGFVDNVIPYLQAMDVFVLPSLTETTSLATMEAMSCGVPVIATPVGLIKEYIDNGCTGYLFDPEDEEDLTKKMEKLIRGVKFRKVMGNLGRKTMQDKYTWEKTVKELIVSFEDVGVE